MNDSASIFNPENIIALLGIIVTIVLSIIGGIYTIVTSTKKYELTESYYDDLMAWYSNVVEVMIEIIHHCESGVFLNEDFKERRNELLAKLSSLSEIGRFYFPNVIKNDGYGDKKPSAYRGYRNIILEFTIRFYFIASQVHISDDDIKKNAEI